MTRIGIVVAIAIGFASGGFAQLQAQAPATPSGPAASSDSFDAHRPPRVFRAEFKRVPDGGTPPQHPLVQDDLLNQNLELKSYGGVTVQGPIKCTAQGHGQVTLCPDGSGVLWVQHARDPTFAWTGMCATNCAVSFRDKTNVIDLTGPAKIRWRVKPAGLHLLRPIIRLVDGS